MLRILFLKTTLENGLDYTTLNNFPFPIVLHNFIANNKF